MNSNSNTYRLTWITWTTAITRRKQIDDIIRLADIDVNGWHTQFDQGNQLDLSYQVHPEDRNQRTIDEDISCYNTYTWTNRTRNTFLASGT